jgi:hypothetical protein
MNLLGLEISFSKNGKYVKQEECLKEHNLLTLDLDRRFSSLKEHVDTRVEDLKDFLLKNHK